MLEALSHFNTWASYPFSTGAHWILMGLAGVLIIRSHYRGGPAMRCLAIIIVALFVSYETLEQLRISDDGDIDVANGFMSLLLASAGTWLAHYLRARWKRRGD